MQDVSFIQLAIPKQLSLSNTEIIVQTISYYLLLVPKSEHSYAQCITCSICRDFYYELLSHFIEQYILLFTNESKKNI